MKSFIKAVFALLILTNLSFVTTPFNPKIVQKLSYSLNQGKRVEELITSFATLEKGKISNKIEGYDYTDFLSLEINLSSLQPGTYATDEKNSLFFSLSISKLYDGSEGEIVITENKNGKLSGTFTAKLTPQLGTTDKSIKSITGSFVNIDIRRN